MIRIVIADDQTLMRDGLQTILDLEEDMKVVGLAENGKQAYDLVREKRPDLVLMDIQMPHLNGIESTKWIKKDFPKTIVLFLTTFVDDEYIVEGLSYGADGYLLKDLEGDMLVESIRNAMKGQLMIPAVVASKLASRLAYHASSSEFGLDTSRIDVDGMEFTEKEKKIILLLIEGKKNREIAKLLFMSEGTVRNYISVIYQKIGTNNRAAAILYFKGLLN